MKENNNYSKVKDFVNNVQSEDNDAAKDIFSSLMIDRIKETLNTKKVELASVVYNESMKDMSIDDAENATKKAKEPKPEEPAEVDIEPIDPEENEGTDEVKKNTEPKTK